MSSNPTPAEAYQEYFAPAIFEPLADELLRCATPEPGDRVLDVACGTGIVTRRLAAAVGGAGQVVGVDLNPGMLQVATAQADPGATTIDYRQGDAQALDLPDDSFDLVLCQQGLQFLPDRAAGVREMHRVLVDKGRSAIACWQGLDRHPVFAALTEAEVPHLQAFGVEVTADDVVAPFSLGDADELASLLTSAGFRDVDVVERTIETRFATPERFVERMEYAYAAVVPQFTRDPEVFADYLARITESTRHIVERYVEGDRVVFPMHTHIAVGRS